MCIIVYGLKKDLRRRELELSMEHNPHGNFLAVIRMEPDGGKTIRKFRTLESRPVLDAFDAASADDLLLLHARKASGAAVSLANVHGWEAPEGLTFCHNGILSYFEGIDGQSDSKNFFERILLPCWRGEGRHFSRNVELMLDYFASIHYVYEGIDKTNKFAFLLPDGSVRLYGAFLDDHGARFSNASYLEQEVQKECKENER